MPPLLTLSLIHIYRLLKAKFDSLLCSPFLCSAIDRLYSIFRKQPNTGHFHSAGNTPLDAVIAVSYTHLDVYKRQQQSFPDQHSAQLPSGHAHGLEHRQFPLTCNDASQDGIEAVSYTHLWVLSPERKAPKKEREYAAARLDGVINKIKNVMQTALAKIQRTLMQPEVKQAGKEQVKKKAKESIMDKLAKAKQSADRDNRKRWEREGRIAPTKKQDMEL